MFSELLEGNASALALITAIYADVNQSPEVLANFVALASAGLPEAIPALTELQDLAEILVSVGRNVCIDLSMQLDFEYYDGIFFEFIAFSISRPAPSIGRERPAPNSASTTNSASFNKPTENFSIFSPHSSALIFASPRSDCLSTNSPIRAGHPI